MAKRGVNSEHIFDVKYKTGDVNIIKYPLETLKENVITNDSDKPTTKTAKLLKSILVEQSWDISPPMTAGASTSITAGMPMIGENDIEVSMEKTLHFSKGTTHKESTTHSVALEVDVPAKHSCRVSMEAYKYGADIPFTARLKRIHGNRESEIIDISGTYKSIQVGDVQTVVDPCQPL